MLALPTEDRNSFCEVPPHAVILEMISVMSRTIAGALRAATPIVVSFTVAPIHSTDVPIWCLWYFSPNPSASHVSMVLPAADFLFSSVPAMTI